MALGEQGELVRPTMYNQMVEAYPPGFVPNYTGENSRPEWLLHLSVYLRSACAAIGIPSNQPFLADVYRRDPAADKLHQQRLMAIKKHSKNDIRVRLLGYWA